MTNKTSDGDFGDLTIKYLVDRQAVFDRVSLHLIKQNKKSSSWNLCRYRAGVLSCGVGCLITDEAYHPSLEGSSPEAFNVQEALQTSEPNIDWCYDMLQFLKELQMIHDESKVEEWGKDLTSLATREGMSTSAFEKEWKMREGLRNLGEAMNKQRNEETGL